MGGSAVWSDPEIRNGLLWQFEVTRLRRRREGTSARILRGVFLLADSDILTLVCASPASDALGRTAYYKRNTSAEQSLDRPPVCIGLIGFFGASLLLAG